jgi:hypothetical protein
MVWISTARAVVNDTYVVLKLWTSYVEGDDHNSHQRIPTIRIDELVSKIAGHVVKLL